MHQPAVSSAPPRSQAFPPPRIGGPLAAPPAIWVLSPPLPTTHRPAGYRASSRFASRRLYSSRFSRCCIHCDSPASYFSWSPVADPSDASPFHATPFIFAVSVLAAPLVAARSTLTACGVAVADARAFSQHLHRVLTPPRLLASIPVVPHLNPRIGKHKLQRCLRFRCNRVIGRIPLLVLILSGTKPQHLASSPPSPPPTLPPLQPSPTS